MKWHLKLCPYLEEKAGKESPLDDVWFALFLLQEGWLSERIFIVNC